jgi:hypothetical protein
MRTVVHPAGEVVLCMHCGAVRHCAPSLDPPRLHAV